MEVQGGGGGGHLLGESGSGLLVSVQNCHPAALLHNGQGQGASQSSGPSGHKGSSPAETGRQQVLHSHAQSEVGGNLQSQLTWAQNSQKREDQNKYGSDLLNVVEEASAWQGTLPWKDHIMNQSKHNDNGKTVSE